MGSMDIIHRHGVSTDDLVEAAFELYVGHEGKEDVQTLKKKYLMLLDRYTSDPNVLLLLEAASHLDEVIKTSQDNLFGEDEDPEALVADELIGMSIAEYIGGKRALFNYVRYDREKPGALARLPPFMDDAIGALVAATMTRLFEE